MDNTSSPRKVAVAWAQSAGGSFIRQVPVASQIGVHDGYASYTDGFPPLNFEEVAAGGVPPFGQDFNGALNDATSAIRWLLAGGAVTYDATFQAGIGGYPAGAIVQSASIAGKMWRSTTDNNVTNPDAAGAGWIENGVRTFNGSVGAVTFGLSQLLASMTQVVFTTSGTWTPPAGVTRAIGLVVGAGGAGAGGTTAKAGAGGGAGGSAQGIFTCVPAVALTITVGTGGTAASAADGGAGGSSSIDVIMSATGGSGGHVVANAAGGAPGAGSGGTDNASGGYGADGQFSATTTGGQGGASIYGGGGRSGSNGGVAGAAPGSGGGGGYGGSNSLGGAGANGRVVIYY